MMVGIMSGGWMMLGMGIIFPLVVAILVSSARHSRNISCPAGTVD